MPLKKRKPGFIIKKAEHRLKGMIKVDAKYNAIIDYGGPNNPLSSIDVKQQIGKCKKLNNDYNEALKIADTRAEMRKEADLILTEMYSRILSGCVSKFGSDAIEVSLLGGTRKSERKKHVRKIINKL